MGREERWKSVIEARWAKEREIRGRGRGTQERGEWKKRQRRERGEGG